MGIGGVCMYSSPDSTNFKPLTWQYPREHYEHAMERSGGGPVPPALSLAEDSQYLRTIVRMVLDGEISTAVLVEVNEGISVPRAAMNHFVKSLKLGRKKIPAKVKASFAVAMAVELGWAALEPYLLMETGVEPKETEEVRAHAKVIARRFMEQVGEDLQGESR